MRILAIRGENLASLHGPFAIDFEDEPLARAGLFAITGPTGAGKSTLLDAICLALYGSTPRLKVNGARGHAVGHEEAEERLTSTDPASLLRKGTATGYAEVVFLGRDGVRYRARWSVRRARDRVDGRLQHPQVELWNEATEEAIGRTRTEVYSEIETRVGLSYEQFCRSVLLAQGEFARFLLANEKERAELLERVTGTEIYRHLSIAAHHRLGEAKAAVAEVEGELAGVQVLSEAEREALEAKRDELAEALQKVRADSLRAQQAVAWYETLAALEGAQVKAMSALKEADEAWEEAAPLRERLDAAEQVQPLRQVIEGVQQAALAASTAKERHGDAEAKAQGAVEAAKAAEAQVAEAEERWKAAQARSQEMAPAIASARRLDAAIEAAKRDVEGAAAAAKEATEQRAEREREVKEVQGRIEAQASARKEAEAWLAAHASLEPLATQWELRRDQLLRIEDAWRAEKGALGRASTLAKEVEAVRGKQKAAAEAAQGAEADWTAAEAQAKEAGVLAARTPKGTLRDRREALDGAERRARELEGLASEASRRRGDALVLRKEGKEASQAAATGREALVGLDAQRKLLAEQLETAEATLQKGRQSLGLKEERALLREGDPCPLCGSCQHPWAEKNVAIAAKVREREAQVVGLRRQLEGVESQRAEAKARAEGAAQRAKELTQRADDLEAGVAPLQGRWNDQRPALEEALTKILAHLVESPEEGAEAMEPWDGRLPEQAADGRAREALADVLQRVAFAKRQLAKEEQEGDRLDEAWAEARARAERLREQKEASAAEARRLEGELERLGDQERKERERAAEVAREAAALYEPLRPVLAELEGGAAAFEAAPVAFIEGRGADVEAWRARDAGRREAAGQLEALGLRQKEAVRWLEALEGQAAVANEKHEACVAALKRLQEERAGMLEGADVASFEASLQEALAAATTARDEAREVYGQAQRLIAERAALRDASAATLKEAEKAHAAAVDARDRSLEEAGLALEVAVERLAHAPEEVARWRRDLQEREKRRETAKALVEDRKEALEAHGKTERPALTEEAARAALEELVAPSAEAEEAFHDARNALRADDEARARSAAVLPRLEALQREAEKWAALHELIGSASGDKFQLFAQSMTLEVLLSHANVHLAELAPRYRLERVPGHDLQLQVVDGDMGDEVRAANSLSGGETFLVSLALALGLSGLSSTTQVESLFVDEGFGSLDPQTLDVALASLDALQATGRKVGVISHVQGMAERIGVQVQVQPQGSGRSRVQVVSG